jgi:SAM-dependent methyltransferase
MAAPTSPYLPAWTELAERAEIGNGSRLLDVGCGEGAFCEFAAARGAAVHGLDGEPERIALAAQRVPQGDFRIGLIEDLPWPDRTFDVVTGLNAFQYALDVERALAEARRVTHGGGRIAICKWGEPKDNEFFAFLGSLGAGRVSHERLPATDPVQDAMGRIRLDVLATGTVAAPMEMADAAALESALDAAGIVRGARARVATAAAPYRQEDGGYRFENRLRYWIARP